MKKLLLVSIILLGIFWYFYPTKKPALVQPTRVLPTTTVFAFDIHNVLLYPRYLDIGKALWKDFLRVAPFSLLMKPQVWYDVYQLMKNSIATERIFAHIHKEYTNIASFNDLITDIMKAQYLNNAMIDVLRSLKAQGYSLYILSNIWKNSLDHIYTYFPIFKELFDGAYIPSKDGNGTQKPSLRFYEGFKKYLETKGQENKQIIFVDNDKENIQEAQKSGLYVILFTSTKEFIEKIVPIMQS